MIRKLKSLEKDELQHLIRKKIWLKTTRRASKSLKTLSDIPIKKHLRKDHPHPPHYPPFKSRNIKFYFDDEDLSVIKKQHKILFGPLEDSLLIRADRLCRRNYTFLNSHFSFPGQINWHLDPLSKHNWPKTFFQDIPYTGSRRTGDIKLPWELARHQFLVTLGRAYCLNQDDKYAKEVISIINSWIDENPPYIGIHWVSALELAIRLISWVWAFHLIKASNHITKEFFNKLLSAVWVQTNYIENNLNIGRYSNNHLIGEAASLVITGLYFYEFKHSPRWVIKGLSILEKEVLKQIYPDGGGVEQAPGYLRFIVEFSLLAFLLAQKNNLEVSSAAMDRIEKAFNFMALTLMPDGTAPRFGDSDDARAIFLGDDEFWDFRGILALGAALFKRSDFKMIAGRPSADLLWLAGKDGLKIFENLKSEKPNTTSYLFQKSGYATLRDSWETNANCLIFDCGPLGYKSAGHGHADALSIQLASEGKPTLVDPGTFAYNQEQIYRNYMRRTTAHNTVSVDGMDQAQMSGRMSWDSPFHTVVKNHYFSKHLDFITAENNGYERLLSPVTHERTVIFNKASTYFLIVDRLKSNHLHDYALHYHLPPQAVVKNDGRITVVLDSKSKLYFTIKCSENALTDFTKRSTSPKALYSTGYGHMCKAPLILYKCKSTAGAVFCTLIVPDFKSQQDRILAFSQFIYQRENGSINFTLHHNDFTDTWVLNDCCIETSFEGICFNGRNLYIRKNKNKDLSDIFTFDSLCLKIDGKNYLKVKKPFYGRIL